MSKKRKIEETDIAPEQSAQQKLRVSGVDHELVEIYDRLSDEKESRRLKAASKLLKKLQAVSATSDHVHSALRRLFRGLCSSRKAARQGFATALTELLSQLASRQINAPLASDFLVSILEDTTSPEGGATKQEERDHFIGRVFGADAIIKSDILTSRNDREQWKRLLRLLCTVAQKKPWLRQECGWLLYHFVAAHSDASSELFTEDVIDIMTANKMIRTPEGAAVWLAAKRSYPKAKMLKHVWKHGHPLASKDVKTLAEIMKDAKSQSAEDGTEAQGAATWSVKLHFAWTVVLEHLFQSNKTENEKNEISQSPADNMVTFVQFWRTAVDNGLFGADSSPERKQWGVLVWILALQRAPPNLIPEVLTKNAMHCLITALNDKDSYRRKICENGLQEFESRVQALSKDEEHCVLNAACVKAIIGATDFTDVDRLTKSKLLSGLLTTGSVASRSNTKQVLQELFEGITDDDSKSKLAHQRYIIELESKLLSGLLRDTVKGDLQAQDEVALGLILRWLSLAYETNAIERSIKTFLRERVESCLEQYIRTGARGRLAFMSCIKSGIVEQIEKGKIQCEKQVRKIVTSAWRQISRLGHSTQVDQPSIIHIHQGLTLLHGILIMELVNGEADAAGGLQELVSMNLQFDSETQLPEVVDSLVEIVLSLATRPSKFLRLVSQQIFGSIASQITQQGLGSLIRIITSKENARGRQEMLEAVDDADHDLEVVADSEASDDELDSDVEVVDAPEEDPASDSAAESESGTESSDEDDDSLVDQPTEDGERDEDEELAAFDAALASALGTQKLENGDDDSDTSDSDSDMDDDQMIALDEKLTEVFRARKEASSKKKELKDTKEAFINFKNRVLDLIDVYLKHELQNPLAMELVLPLLESIRITQTKQLADRVYNTLRQFFAKCKGDEVPKIQKNQSEDVLAILKSVHEEACREGSNAHASVASSASIFLVKVWVKAGCDIDTIIDVYGMTRKRQMRDKTCRVQPAFFTEWNNWCSQARTQLSQ